MAYFANGTDGMRLDVLCGHCIHGESCMVYYLQAIWNYEQMKNNDPDAAIKRIALNNLVPDDAGLLCSMFIEETNDAS